jgi:hypothetical protein
VPAIFQGFVPLSEVEILDRLSQVEKRKMLKLARAQRGRSRGHGEVTGRSRGRVRKSALDREQKEQLLVRQMMESRLQRKLEQQGELPPQSGAL